MCIVRKHVFTYHIPLAYPVSTTRPRVKAARGFQGARRCILLIMLPGKRPTTLHAKVDWASKSWRLRRRRAQLSCDSKAPCPHICNWLLKTNPTFPIVHGITCIVVVLEWTNAPRMPVVPRFVANAAVVVGYDGNGI
jgi:hypothetical protein